MPSLPAYDRCHVDTPPLLILCITSTTALAVGWAGDRGPVHDNDGNPESEHPETPL